MQTLTRHDKGDIRTDTRPARRIRHPRAAIIRSTARGSDLHIFHGVKPGMQRGDVIGQETMGEVVETGCGMGNLKPANRVVAPFTVSCGE